MRKTIMLAVMAAIAGGSVAILAPRESAESAVVSTVKGGPLYGVLLGRNEISPEGKKKAGDKDGRGSASAIIDEGRLCFGLTVKNLDAPAAAHIHRGTRGKNGPIVLALVEPLEGDPGASSGCVPIQSDLRKALLKNPHRFYWNVHTADFPGGAIRGQVFARTR